jgi:DNA-binding CsgD family transcriptional regulator
MNEPDRSMTLAGLVGQDAELLYKRLRVAGSMATENFRATGAAATELLDTGIAFHSGQDDGLIRPVEPATALRLLLGRRQGELVERQERIMAGWQRLTAMLPPAFDGSPSAHVDGVRLMTNFDEVVTRAAELYPSPRHRLRGTETGEFPTRPTKNRIRTPPAGAVRAGVRFQMIYHAGYLDTKAGSEIIRDSARSGEEVRLRDRMPVKMLHVDDSIALVGIGQLARTALLVRSEAILTMLAEWFDLLWSDPTTVRLPDDTTDHSPEEIQFRVLRMMSTDDDTAIARRLKLSVSTVRRHIKSLYGQLGVDNRFAAGMVAAKRGWI